MPNTYKADLLAVLAERFGKVSRLSDSHSLFSIGDDAARIYFRYSKVHEGGRTFFGLRDIDLRQLEGHNSFLCFLLDDGSTPAFVPFCDFEDIFRSAEPASDGQHKVQIVLQQDERQLYIAKKGRFSIEGYFGLESVEQSVAAGRLRPERNLSHSQVQTLLAGIANLKGLDAWVPDTDVNRLDWTVTKRFSPATCPPAGFGDCTPILAEIDVIWVQPGSNRIQAMFEVEHSTPVYSGLLRFNDVLLTQPTLNRFHIVSNEIRRSVFSRQAFRPTFRKSGLSDMVSFLEYSNVFDWHARLAHSNGGKPELDCT